MGRCRLSQYWWNGADFGYLRQHSSQPKDAISLILDLTPDLATSQLVLLCRWRQCRNGPLRTRTPWTTSILGLCKPLKMAKNVAISDKMGATLS